MPITSADYQHIPFDDSGTIQLAPGVPGAYHKVVGFIVSGRVGTQFFWFSDGTDQLTGQIRITATSPPVVATVSQVPLLQVPMGRPLEIVASAGSIGGVVVFVTEP